jgi:hypothetical protein
MPYKRRAQETCLRPLDELVQQAQDIGLGY